MHPEIQEQSQKESEGVGEQQEQLEESEWRKEEEEGENLQKLLDEINEEYRKNNRRWPDILGEREKLRIVSNNVRGGLGLVDHRNTTRKMEDIWEWMATAQVDLV